MGFLPVVIITVVLLLGLFAAGQPVAMAMFVVGLIGLNLLLPGSRIASLENVLWNSSNSFVLTALPLFLFMGEVLLRIDISGRLYRGIAPWLGRLPGGLLHSNIGACAVFAAISGSSIATAAAIGTVAIPEMEKRRYDTSLLLGSLAAGGTLGILIPPSITMIVYGSMVNESVGQLFMAGVIPGIILALLFMLYILIRVWLQPHLAPRTIATSWKEKLSTSASMLPATILIFLVLGTIYTGIATPTEAAALGTSGSLVLGLAYRSLSWQMLKESLLQALRTTSAIMIIFVAAQLIALLLGYVGLPTKLANAVTAAAVPPLVTLIVIYIVYLILGCFFDPMSMMVLTLPVFFPVVVALGFHPVWFGVIVVILVEAGMLTPPVGMNLYVIQGIAPRHGFDEIVAGAMPFFGIQLLMIALLTVFPILALWLPSHMITIR